MEELVVLSVQLHLIFIGLLLGLIVANIYLLKSDKTFFKLSKRLELLAPQYYIVLSAIFFTGIIVMAIKQFTFSFAVWEMLVAWVLLVGFGIRGHKVYKKVEPTETSQNAYKRMALKKYMLDIALIGVVLILVYGVH